MAVKWRRFDFQKLCGFLAPVDGSKPSRILHNLANVQWTVYDEGFGKHHEPYLGREMQQARCDEDDEDEEDDEKVEQMLGTTHQGSRVGQNARYGNVT